MKKVLLLTFVSVFILAGCQEKEYVYSCNDEVNSQVLENLEEITNLTRSEWLKMEEGEYRMASFRAFTPKQRHTFLTAKINETLSFGWSKLERQHILKLQQFINDNPAILNPGWEKDQDLHDTYDVFQYKWLEYAKEVLSWDDKLIYAVAFSPEEMKSKEGDLGIILFSDPNEDTAPDDGEGGDLPRCWCHTNFEYCKMGDPAMWFAYCKEGECKGTSLGCQLLLLGSCNGTCVTYSIVH